MLEFGQKTYQETANVPRHRPTGLHSTWLATYYFSIGYQLLHDWWSILVFFKSRCVCLDLIK